MSKVNAVVGSGTCLYTAVRTVYARSPKQAVIPDDLFRRRQCFRVLARGAAISQNSSALLPTQTSTVLEDSFRRGTLELSGQGK